MIDLKEKLGFKAKDRAVEALKKALHEHEEARQDTEEASVDLFALRLRATGDVRDKLEAFGSRFDGLPDEHRDTFSEFRVTAKMFDQTIDDLNVEGINIRDIDEGIDSKKGAAVGAAGAAAGVGVATLGPSAAIAVATTFGTASTGTAISALSGAAATNAALAWLGGGAIAAGGGGVAAGGGILSLFGPVGCVLGIFSIIGSIFFMRSKNRKAKERAEADMARVEVETRALQIASKEIKSLADKTKEHMENLTLGIMRFENEATEAFSSLDPVRRGWMENVLFEVRGLTRVLQKEVGQ